MNQVILVILNDYSIADYALLSDVYEVITRWEWELQGAE